MTDFISRLKDEKIQLDEKIEKLGVFLDSSSFYNINYDQQMLLKIQYQVMTTYAYILGERIKNLT